MGECTNIQALAHSNFPVYLLLTKNEPNTEIYHGKERRTRNHHARVYRSQKRRQASITLFNDEKQDEHN